MKNKVLKAILEAARQSNTFSLENVCRIYREQNGSSISQEIVVEMINRLKEDGYNLKKVHGSNDFYCINQCSAGPVTKTCFSILGLSSTATEDEIKKAYRTLAQRHHPDHGGSVESFRQVHAAYEQALSGK